MTNREKWKRQQCLRVELVCLAWLLIIWGFRSGWICVDSVKAVLLKQVTEVNPKEPNPFHNLDGFCFDSPNFYDAAIAREELTNIEPNSI
jgi:hypothetical protein